MNEPLPEFWYDYLLDFPAPGFNENCPCVSCQMVRAGYARWLKKQEREKEEQEP